MLVVAASASLVAAWGCNAILGIEDKDRPVAQADAAAGADDTGSDAPTLSAVPSCLGDRDCPALDSCLVPRCNLAAHRCVYATCEPNACQRGTCNAATRSCTTTTNPYGTVSQTLGLPGVAVGCANDASKCFAAANQYAFVGTSAGVIAISLADLTTIEPARIPVDLPFAPAAIVASGDIVYFLGPIAGGKLTIASLVVPADPRSARFSPDVAEIAYPFPTVRLLPGPDGDVLLVHDDASLGFPTARLDRTFRARAPIVHVPAPASADAGPTAEPAASTGMYGALGVDRDGGDFVGASSGDRVVLGRPGPGPAARFTLLTNAGTSHAAVQPPAFRTGRQPLFLGRGSFGMGPNGVVLWAAPWFYPTGDPTLFNVYNMGFWLLNSDGEPFIQGADEYYTPDYRANVPSDAGGGDIKESYPALPLLVDASILFFVETNKSTSPSGVSVFAVRHGPGSATQLFASKAIVLQEPDTDMAPGKVGIAQTVGYGLLLLPSPQGMRVVVLDPRCQPAP